MLMCKKTLQIQWSASTKSVNKETARKLHDLDGPHLSTIHDDHDIEAHSDDDDDADAAPV